ncbi:MAG: HAMP domain-containing histidine kinase [Cyclobacteriaceae bacterium]|nr:HAMP domain-containing histidine kinase [Cyclobacteriaceae bacterium]
MDWQTDTFNTATFYRTSRLQKKSYSDRFMSLAQKLFWGSRPIVSRHEFKYAMLRGEFAIIILMVGVFYSFLDSVNGVFVFIPWYSLMIAMSAAAIVLNRRKHYTSSTVIILFIINFLVYIFADVDHPDGGVFFYFMTSSMAGLILLSYYNSKAGLLFAFFPVPIGYLAFFFDAHLAPSPVYGPGMVAVNFIANFTIALLSTVFMLQFLLNRNKESEESLREQNELLEKTNKELDHFVYSVSHDLRAPLSSILGLTNVYELAKDDTERASMVRMMQERAQTLDNFIREVLDYSKNTRVELRILPVKVKEILDDVIREILFIQGAEEVSIHVHADASLNVRTDKERVKVILTNIIGNAIYYRDIIKRPSVDIESFIKDGKWITIIRDNGIGIPPEHQGRIFEMFYKAHDRAQGTGLGLYIVKETLQRLNGEVTVESVYGEGSTFTVSISAN